MKLLSYLVDLQKPLSRLLMSRKTQAAIIGTVTTFLSQKIGLPEGQAQTVATAVMILTTILIAGIAIEDAAEKGSGTNPSEDSKNGVGK